MTRFLVGDLFKSGASTLVNTVNCVGIMGKGIAQIFKARFPGMFEDYKARCEAGEVRLGEPYLYEDLGGASVWNFPTKQHWKSPSKLVDIEAGLDRRRGVATAAFSWAGLPCSRWCVAIAKTVDLFCRIRSTAQAEEVSTVLYATQPLKAETSGRITEQEVFDYILSWKSQWDTEEGRAGITEAIESLEMLGWIDVSCSQPAVRPD